MKTIRQTETYRSWERKLKDKVVRATIAARIFRLANGLAGDVSSVGESVFELRIHIGPGYRLYYANEGDRIIILLCGGTKRQQQNDIETARRLMKELKGDTTR